MPPKRSAPDLLGEQGIYTVARLEWRKGHWFAVGLAHCCGQPFERRVDRLRRDPACWRCARQGVQRGPYAEPLTPWPSSEVDLLQHRAILSRPFGAIDPQHLVPPRQNPTRCGVSSRTR